MTMLRLTPFTLTDHAHPAPEPESCRPRFKEILSVWPLSSGE